jgi:hypothetical protein
MQSIYLFGRLGNEMPFESEKGHEFSNKYFMCGSTFAKQHRRHARGMKQLEKKQTRLQKCKNLIKDYIK